MIKSMTGYSRCAAETPFGPLIIELKAWNHRYCNVTVRLPNLLSQFEHRIQNLIRDGVARGQIQASIELVRNASGSNYHPALDLALAKQYHQELVRVQNELHLQDDISVALLAQLPGVFSLQESVVGEEEAWNALQSLLETALDGLDETKRAEGSAMSESLDQRLRSVCSLAKEIQSASENVVQAVQAKLENRLNELLQGRVEIDPDRFIMEAGVIASRADINEELVRLDSHCIQFEQSLRATEPIGRPLDFLLQEMNREANTIASKSASSHISSLCVSLKTEIEKIRELVQNVE
jgi:uncharacterized protein (TIGR00255 family)